MPKAFSDLEKDLIRKRLLDHGYRLFSAYGLKKTNVEEIARAAGISKGAFYNFYLSKEELFMDVVELAEVHVRQELLAVIGLPGSTPRLRLLAVFKKAFALFEAIPILRFFTGTDYDLLFHRIPAEKWQSHLASDAAFIEELVSRCCQAGIPIVVAPDQITSLLYPLVLGFLHEADWDQDLVHAGFDMLLELIAAYCLGEVAIEGLVLPGARAEPDGRHST